VILIVGLTGVGFATGIWLLASGLRPWAVASPSPSALGELVREWRHRFDTRRLGIAAAAGLAALVLTRWPAVVAGAVVVGWLVPLPGDRAARRRSEARTEAIAQWCEMLRDAAGTARGIEGILVATASSVPDAIRPEVGRMASRLADEPLDAALTGLAADLSHPIGDLVVTALQVAAGAGSRRVATILANLATAAHHEASMRRRVDVARARPRTTLRLVVGIVALFVVALVVLAGDYMAPYGSPLGQVVLLLIGGYWALGFWWMARLGRIPTPERFLVSRRSGAAR
jgi:tight adherence protein B